MSKALEAASYLRLGILQHVRRNLGADIDALNHAVEARCQRSVVDVVVGLVKHLCLGRREEDKHVQEEAANLGGIIHPLHTVHQKELTPLIVMLQVLLPSLELGEHTSCRNITKQQPRPPRRHT